MMKSWGWAVTIGVFASSGLFANEVTLDFLSPGNNIAGYYYVSPYTAQIKGTNQVLTLYCIDFNHEVDPPTEWGANIQDFDYANVPTMQYGGGAQKQQNTWFEYETAAYLIGELRNSPNTPQGLYEQDIYQYAAWKVFLDPAHTGAFNSSEAAVGANFAALVDGAFNDATAAVKQGASLGSWEIVTPDTRGLANSTQEFLIWNPTDSAPEPSAVILLATVLGGVMLVVRKAARRQASSSTTVGT